MKNAKYSNQRIETLVNQISKIKEQIVTSEVGTKDGGTARWTLVTVCPEKRDTERESQRERRGRRETERDRAGRRGEQCWTSKRACVISVTVAGGRERENCSVGGGVTN